MKADSDPELLGDRHLITFNDLARNEFLAGRVRVCASSAGC